MQFFNTMLTFNQLKLPFRRSLPFGLSLMVLFSACDLFPDPQLREVRIRAKSSNLGDGAFSPNPVHVPVGGRVRWQNDDVLEHDMVAEAKNGPCVFQSGPIGFGKSFSNSFFKKAICDYYCALHGRTMRGRIIVE